LSKVKFGGVIKMTEEINNDDIQDVEYEEIKNSGNMKEKNIRGKALYYSTSQVANVLGITDSKVRYYSVVFDDILNIEVSNKQRRYTDEDIKKMKFLVELKNDGMTIKQIQEYCQDVDFDNDGEIIIKENNPLSIQTLAKALLEEQTKQLNLFKDEIIESISLRLAEQMQNIKDNNISFKEELLEQVALTVDEVVEEKLTINLDEQEKRAIEHEAKMSELFRNSMEERKTQANLEHVKKKEGILSRFFKK